MSVFWRTCWGTWVLAISALCIWFLFRLVLQFPSLTCQSVMQLESSSSSSFAFLAFSSGFCGRIARLNVSHPNVSEPPCQSSLHPSYHCSPLYLFLVWLLHRHRCQTLNERISGPPKHRNCISYFSKQSLLVASPVKSYALMSVTQETLILLYCSFHFRAQILLLLQLPFALLAFSSSSAGSHGYWPASLARELSRSEVQI